MSSRCRLSIVLLAFVLLGLPASVVRASPPDAFRLSIGADAALVEVDQMAEGRCEDRTTCTVRGYRGQRLAYVLVQQDGRERRQIDCDVFDADEDHQCMVTTRAAMAAFATPALTKARPRRRPVVGATASSAPQSATSRGSYFASCRAAKAEGVAPLRRGQPGYRGGLDRDNDGIACE